MARDARRSSAEPLVAYGWTQTIGARFSALLREDSSLAEGAPSLGRVLRPDRTAALTVFEDGQESLPVRPRCRPVTVGDWVVAKDGAIAGVLARSSLLHRRDPSTGNEQLLAANVDCVAVVCGLDRPVKPGRIQRISVLAWDAGAEPVVVLTKSDVVADPEQVVSRTARENPTVDVLTTSSVAEDGLASLRDLAVGRTLVLLGESGAGKSTLVNRLLGGGVVDTADVRPGDRKGRHTTTHRYLHPISTGGCVIDTPGLREVGLWGDPESVDATFGDIHELAANCRYRDCRHDAEPGCAVLTAVQDGDLAVERLLSLKELRREAESAALRADNHARRQEGKRFERMVRQAQQLKGQP